METKQMKTNELTDAALDWAVAKIEGLQWAAWILEGFSNDWAQGGPIIEQEKIHVWWDEDGSQWYAETCLTNKNADETYHCQTGPTPLIAAMRCYVASKLGDEIDVPTNYF